MNMCVCVWSLLCITDNDLLLCNLYILRSYILIFTTTEIGASCVVTGVKTELNRSINNQRRNWYRYQFRQLS